MWACDECEALECLALEITLLNSASTSTRYTAAARIAGLSTERCSREPWLGSRLPVDGCDAGAVAIRVMGREVLVLSDSLPATQNTATQLGPG